MSPQVKCWKMIYVADGGEGTLETVIVTGLSGAGRSTAAKCLEDLGYFVVDNLPPALLAMLFELSGGTPGNKGAGAGGGRSDGAVTRLAVVMDVRSRAFSSDLRGVVRSLADQGKHARVIFLEASDDVLVRRFESNRRPHPLQGEGRLVDGIKAERELLSGIRDDADLIIDTSYKYCATPSRRPSSSRVESPRPNFGRTSSRSGSSTAFPWTRISLWTSDSCLIRTGSRNCAISPEGTPRSATTSWRSRMRVSFCRNTPRSWK
jgi:hypothetical protein